MHLQETNEEQMFPNKVWSACRSAWLVIAILTFSGLLQWLDLAHSFAYDRTAISHGQWWLLLSGNIVHLGQMHYLMNAAGLIVIALLVGHHFNNYEWIFIGSLSSVFVGVCLYLWVPELEWYVGLSGMLNGLLLAGCWPEWRKEPWSGLALATIILGKITYEQIIGPMPGSESTAGGHVIVDAHMYGAIGGACALPFIYGLRAKLSKLAPSH